METWTSKQSGNWSRTSNNADSPWYDAGTQTGWAAIPATTDTVVIANGHVVAIDVAALPATGTLASLSGSGTGYCTLAMSASDVAISATTIQAATYGGPFIGVTGAAPTRTLTINGNIIGGTAGDASCVRTNTTAALVINGNITGGTGNVAIGLYNIGAPASFIITATTITGGSGRNAMGVYSSGGKPTLNNTCNLVNYNGANGGVAWNGIPPTWTPTTAVTQTWSGVAFGTIPAAANMLSGVVCGNVTGTYVGPVQAGYSALAAGYGAGGATAGTLAAAKIMDGTYGTLSLDNVLVAGGGHYVEPVAAQVWNAASGGTAYGASGGYGTFDKTLYTLISGVVAASKVLYGNDNYTGGAAGTLTLPNDGTAPYTANPALVLAAGRYGVVGSLVSGTAPVQNITFTETVITRQ